MPRFVLYRILGNDLPPRHGMGQTLVNLRFILDHEPPLKDCEKRWVVNRIENADIEAQITGLLDKYGQRYLHIPFIDKEYAACHFDFEGLPQRYFLYRQEFHALSPRARHKITEYCYRHKNLYLMNVNAARNAALREGRTFADWVMPFDSACFFTDAAWSSVLEATGRARAAKYLVVSLARVPDNECLLDPAYRPQHIDEPQIAFRRDAGETFDETLRYGTMSKTALLNRLGVPGPWQQMGGQPWDKIDLTPSPESGQYATAGWVARLSSGNSKAETNNPARNLSRWIAIVAACSAADARIIRRSLPPDRLCFFDEAVLDRERQAWLAGEPALVSLVTPMTRRAERRAGAGAAHDDPSPLQQFLDHVTVLALSWYFTREDKFSRHAADLLRAWLVAPATRMNPDLRHAQVWPGHGQEGTGASIVGACGIVYALDAIRLILCSGALSAQDAAALRAWFRAFLCWLKTSTASRNAESSANHIGTCYELHIAVIAIFIDDMPLFCHHLNMSRMRIVQQIQPDGDQPSERQQTRSLHYQLFNLQMWANLARVARAGGIDLWRFESRDGRSLAKALAAIAGRVYGDSSSAHSTNSARVRLEVLQAFASDAAHGAGIPHPAKYGLPAYLHPDTAVAPYWLLGLATR